MILSQVVLDSCSKEANEESILLRFQELAPRYHLSHQNLQHLCATIFQESCWKEVETHCEVDDVCYCLGFVSFLYGEFWFKGNPTANFSFSCISIFELFDEGLVL